MVYEGQRSSSDVSLPFTLESAVQYYLVNQAQMEAGIPEHDDQIEFPKGIEARKVYSLGAEYVRVALSHIFFFESVHAERIRWADAAWFCLGVPLLAVWIYAWTGSWLGAGLAALLYAVGLASVIRSTGQELSRENFALPLLVAHFALEAIALRRKKLDIANWTLLGASAMALAVAQCGWDLIQFVVALRGLSFLVRWSQPKPLVEPLQAGHWLLCVGALAIAGMLNPYLLEHGFLLAPAFLIALSAFVMVAVEHASWAMRLPRPLLGGLVILLTLTFGTLLSNGENYSHFVELFWAKLRFLAVKPTDPSLLTFNQRILWVPALNSTHPMRAWMLFPASFLLTLPAIVVLFKHSRRSTQAFNLLVLLSISLLTFGLFYRFHVFVALFACAAAGWWVAHCFASTLKTQVLALALIAVVVPIETAHTLDRPWRWGRPNVYYNELNELNSWLSKTIPGEPVLANFGVSGSIVTYGRCPVLLHPKFETKYIRDRVEAYGKVLFKHTEKEFRDWAVQEGARYYVYSIGEFAKQSIPLQMRYMVDAVDAPDDAAARVFEERPMEAKWLKYRWGNRKYRVFELVSIEDEEMAESFLAMAQEALAEGRLEQAESAAIKALAKAPLPEAMKVVSHAASLRSQGFTYVPE